MKAKTIILTSLLVFMMVFVSCATKPAEEPVNTATEEWWNTPPADTDEIHYEVGFAKGTNLQTSRDWAKANANQALAQYVSTAVDSIVTTYVDDAGELATDNMQSLQAFQSVSKQRAQATLTGVRYRFQQADEGVYALAELPIGPLAETLKQTMQESFVENKASEAAKEEMSKAIDKYFN